MVERARHGQYGRGLARARRAVHEQVRELALLYGASQCFGDLLLGREVVDGRGAVLLDPELRPTHGFCCCLRRRRANWRLLDLARFFCAAGTARRNLQRALVIYGLLDNASWRAPAMVSIAGRPGLFVSEFEP